jgi:glucosamine kinase
MGRVLAIDGGRSQCRAAVLGPTGREIAAEGRGIPPLGGPEGIQGIVQAVGEAAALCSVNSETLEAVTAGLAGMLGSAEHAGEVARGLRRLLGVDRIVVTGDAVTGFAGALGLQPGVVMCAGTGAVALGVSADASARSDGWGWRLGDAGSGYWIGRRGLEQALRAQDGRGGSPLLAGLAEGLFGPLDDLSQRVEGSGNPTGYVAGFARQVGEAARRGDTTSLGIWAEAASELAASAAACARRLFPPGQAVAVSWSGGLFTAADLLLEPFLDRLRALVPEAVPTPPASDALAGAALLAGSSGPGILSRFVHDSAVAGKAGRGGSSPALT